MASEDSDEISPGLLAVHRLSDLSDANEPFIAQMHASIDQLNTSGELLEVPLLGGVHRMPPEEGNDPFDQVGAFPHDVSI